METRSKPKRRGRTPSGSTPSGAPVQSLTRGLIILEKLAQAGGGLSLTDLSQGVGLAASTTHRLLNTLESQAFVHQRGDLGLWYVGVKAFSVGCAYLDSRDLVAQSHAYLVGLVERSGETANLAVMDEGEVVYIDQVQCREMMRMLAKLGSRAAMHASGVGKALLSGMPASAVASILKQQGLPRLCPNTIDDPLRFNAELEAIRQRGFALDDEEHAIGLRCVAAPIFNEHGEAIAAISVAGPLPRISDERMQALGAMVRVAAAAITQALGGRPMPRRSLAA